MDNYPSETANDSLNNQPLTEPYEVTVSITLSKTFTVDVLKHEDRLVNEADVRLQHFLPDEILNQKLLCIYCMLYYPQIIHIHYFILFILFNNNEN